MTKKEVQAKIDAVLADIEKYEGIKEQLETLQSNLSDNKNTLHESVYDPISEPYPLGGEAGDDWAGLNYNEAEDKRSTISSNLGTYDGEIDTLSSEISEAIKDVEEKISKLNEELEQLYIDLENAPEEEPESSGSGGGGGGGSLSVNAQAVS
ncbi:hypothetical protein [Butyrivibrio proteoclasticus]|uniref:hypothetical protein n=1 Tax=Butyrivibrio proteoclasticus TaxID=43305 RepID=UPI00047E917D|nr:hypothetical protein [Butyrivibrio proteoclasticus]